MAVINPYTWGTGRRKSAVARVRIKSGSGKITINKRAADDYFKHDAHRNLLYHSLKVTQTQHSFDVWANIRGGGITGQAEAFRLGLARALKKHDENYEQSLRKAGFLTVDARRKERKKYGRRGARRGCQFSKR